MATALLFWYPVVRPYPSRPRWSRWLLLPYLLLADLQNTLLAAWLTFSSDVLYPHYTQVPRLAGISALSDQAATGVLMWVPGSIAFLVPFFWISVELLFDSEARRERKRIAAREHRVASSLPELPIIYPAPTSARPAFDALRLPLVGRFLRWRFSRPAMQLLKRVLNHVAIAPAKAGHQR